MKKSHFARRQPVLLLAAGAALLFCTVAETQAEPNLITRIRSFISRGRANIHPVDKAREIQASLRGRLNELPPQVTEPTNVRSAYEQRRDWERMEAARQQAELREHALNAAPGTTYYHYRKVETRPAPQVQPPPAPSFGYREPQPGVTKAPQESREVRPAPRQPKPEKKVAKEAALTLKASEPAPAEAPATTKKTPDSDSSKLPYGQPIPGKTGFVYSPYTSEKGQVDVQDIPSGTKVECPYTTKVFRVP